MKLYFLKFHFTLLFLLISFLILVIEYKNNFKDFYQNKRIKLNYNYKFIIIQRKIKLSTRGLMAYYFMNMGCVIDYIYRGFIPIIDLTSHPNIFNGFNNNSRINPWEIFFNQPFGYTLDNIFSQAKHIEYVYCERGMHGPNFSLFYTPVLVNYWHNIAKIYMPIKEQLIYEAKLNFISLFNKSNNILGILIRGTDYISIRPTGHPIQPNSDMVIEDVIKMEHINNYDWLFLTTEDDSIRDKFIKQFGKKLKYIKSRIKINYDYKKKQYLANCINLKGNIPYYKIYILNIIILSKCLDIITSRTGGSLVAMILSKGFRNTKVYYLGWYK